MTASRIASKLYQGSVPPGVLELVRARIHTVVFCAVEEQPDEHRFPRVEVLRCPFDDSHEPLDFATRDMIVATAARVAERVRKKQRTLVTCAQGRNRSGLVTALVLTELYGVSGRAAVTWVRRERVTPYGPALSNPVFVALLDGIPARPRERAHASV